jgi:hypothetical protein
MVCEVGADPDHVAVPIVIPVVPSSSMLLGLPPPRLKEKLPLGGGAPASKGVESAPTAEAVTVVGSLPE